MNKLLTLLLLAWLGGLTILSSSAQGTDSLRQQLDHLFAPLDKSQVPAPFLEEFGLHFLPLDVFNGTLTDSSRTNIQAFRMAYASLLTSHITGNPTLPTLSDLNTRLSTQVAASAAVPIVVQRITYAALRPDALTAGLLTTQNGQLYDVPGRPASPYVSRVLFMASPARSVVPNGEVSFVFTQNLYVQSGSGSVQQISIDFSDGRGYLPATWGQPIGASYCAAGTYRVKVRLSYGKQGTCASHFDLEVREPGCVSQATRPASAARYANIGSKQYFSANAQHSGGWAYIRYGDTSRTQLARPLIVAEGYDVSSIAPDLQDNYTINDFLRNIGQSGLYYDLENASNSIPGGVTGYDIVFIDYNNGTDDIRRNAALFKEVIDWVNTNKTGGTASGEQNVVLGISMGGLVARYGLAQMERAQPNSTHTRLLITHDSPHRGANTPLGLQALTLQANAVLAVQIASFVGNLYGVDIFPELHQAEELLKAPATQQLLVVRATRSRISVFSVFDTQYNSFINDEYQPVVSEDSNQPFPYRFVATSLGSQCGIGSLTPHAELVRYTYAGFISPLPWILRQSYESEILVNALPSPGQVERLSSLRVYVKVRILSVFSFRSYFTNFAFHSPSNNPVAWDGLPGGTQNVSAQANIHPPTPNYSLLWFVSSHGSFYKAGDFCFVPTASALDVPVITPTTAQASYLNNITSTGIQPIATKFVAQAAYSSAQGNKYNYPHPFFPARQAQWLFNEMQNVANNYACSAECNPAADKVISGPLTLCVGSSGPATYTSPLQGSGYTYTWTASPAYAFTVSSGTGPTFQTANVPGVDDRGSLTLTVNTGCAFTFSKELAIGAPAELDIEVEEKNDCSHEAWLRIVNYDPALTYTRSGQGISAIRPDGRFRVKATAYSISVSNSCGTTSTTRYLTFDDCPAGPQYALYPNPADEQLTVEQTDSTSTSASPAAPRGTAARGSSAAPSNSSVPSQPYTVRLYDGYGVQRAQQATTTPTLSLPTSGLPTGLYLLHIEAGGAVVQRRRVQITH